MSGCDFCVKCNPKRCPKKGKGGLFPTGYLALTPRLCKMLDALCKSKRFMCGEEYYKIPDYNAAILFLLNKHYKRR